ncbi:MAG: dihydrolipoamide acetyltransferase family protein, partial [Streptosporangiaceae bacterium]
PAPPAVAGAALRASPLARRIARDRGIELGSVTGTGPGGRIVRADVEAAAAAESFPPRTPVASAQAAGGQADDEEIPLTAIRRITARRLTESAAAPHFHLTAVIDAGPLLAFRADVNARLAAAGAKVSVTDLLVRACAVTLRAHPRVNSSWADDKIIVHRRIHVGIAVAVDDGLIVPVIRDADRRTLGEISAEARALAERARAGKLVPEEFTGGTFTISNLGMLGVDSFTAVINPPEAAILAVGALAEEAVIRDGQLAGRMTMRITLTSDHRVLDGAIAAAFLGDLRDILQEPLRIVI